MYLNLHVLSRGIYSIFTLKGNALKEFQYSSKYSGPKIAHYSKQITKIVYKLYSTSADFQNMGLNCSRSSCNP